MEVVIPWWLLLLFLGLVYWVYRHCRWIIKVNRLPRQASALRKSWVADLGEIWRAPVVPGTSQPDVLPQFAQYAAKMSKLGHGMGLLWLFNPKRVTFARPLLLIWDQKLVAEILEPKNYGKFNKGRRYSQMEQLFGQGLQTVEDGPRWICQRHLAQQGFNPETLDDSVVAARTALEHLFKVWDAEPQVKVVDDMRRVALDVFGKVALDHDFKAFESREELPELCVLLDYILEIFDRLARASPFLQNFIGGKLQQDALAQVDALAGEIVQKAKGGKEEPQGSLVRHLMWSMAGPAGREPVLDQSQILDTLKTFLLAGHDGTASSMSWALHLLARNLAKQQRLFEEVHAFFAADQGKDADASAYRALPFLNAVIKETLRLHPPTAIYRTPAADITIGAAKEGDQGHVVPYGCDMMILPGLLGREGRLFEDADSFKPERWLDKKEGSEPANPEGYIPFGFGRRCCVGEEFAMTKMRVVLAHIVQRYKLISTDDQPRPLFCFTITPSPFKLQFERRAEATKPVHQEPDE